MADIQLRVIPRSAKPLPCVNAVTCGADAVARVTMTFGLAREDETLWCLGCLDAVDLASVLAVLNLPAPVLRLVA